MYMLAFDPIGVMSHDILRVFQYFTIPSRLYKRSEAVVRLVRRRARAGREAEINRRRETPE